MSVNMDHTNKIAQDLQQWCRTGDQRGTQYGHVYGSTDTWESILQQNGLDGGNGYETVIRHMRAHDLYLGKKSRDMHTIRANLVYPNPNSNCIPCIMMSIIRNTPNGRCCSEHLWANMHGTAISTQYGM